MIGTSLLYALAYRLAGSAYRGGLNNFSVATHAIYGGTSIKFVGWTSGYQFNGTWFDYGAGWHGAFGSHSRIIRATVAGGTNAGTWHAFTRICGTDVIAYSTFVDAYSPSSTLYADWNIYMGTIRPFNWDNWTALACEYQMLAAIRVPQGNYGFHRFNCASLVDMFNTTVGFVATKVSESVAGNVATLIFRGTSNIAGEFHLGRITLCALTSMDGNAPTEKSVFEHTRYWELEQFGGTATYGYQSADFQTIAYNDIWAGTYYWVVEGVLDPANWSTLATAIPDQGGA